MIRLSPRISIISGPVGSGKTTRLIQWLDNTPAFGFISPIKNQLRILQNVADRKSITFETLSEENTITVGRYHFDPTAFGIAASWLEAALDKPSPLIVIDEIGKLEINKQGFDPYLWPFFEKARQKTDIHLMIIIRDYLLQSVIDRYKLNTF